MSSNTNHHNSRSHIIDVPISCKQTGTIISHLSPAQKRKILKTKLGSPKHHRRQSATNAAHTPPLLQAYLYTRMYYNKIRKTIHHWWKSYLLFKCSIIVLPIYSFLVVIGLYCYTHRIDPAPQVKTAYQFCLLILSAAVIFIFVLLLATINGDNRPPTEDDDGSIGLEIDLDSIQLPRRRGEYGRTRPSITSSLFATFFGYSNDDDDEIDDDDVELDDDELMEAAAYVRGVESRDYQMMNSNIDSRHQMSYDPVSTLIAMNQRENRMVRSLEQATDGLEQFIDQYNSMELSLEDHRPYRPHNYKPLSLFDAIPSTLSYQMFDKQQPPRYSETPIKSTTTTPTTTATLYRSMGQDRMTNHATLMCSPTFNPLTIGNHLAPPIPPRYTAVADPSSINDNSLAIHQSNVQLHNNQPINSNTSILLSPRDLPPSYEEATNKIS